MRIFVKTKPSSRVEKINKIDDRNFIVTVKEPPAKGRANKAIVKALADYFKISRSDIKIIQGHKSKQKVIKINNR